jgi:hypothetical protein
MDGMISRLTLFSLLLGLMLGLGIYMHSQSEHDRCSAYPPGGVQPRSEYVITGERQVEVPCSEWFLRQSLVVQILFVTDILLGFVFAVNVLADLRRWIQWRRERRLGRPTGPVE